MSRVRTADTCRDHHQVGSKAYTCARRHGHKGRHGHGRVTWPRRIPPPPPNSSTAAAAPPLGRRS